MTRSIKEINKVGDSFRYHFSFTQNDVNLFAEISGDKNPIHLDEAYAEKSIFGKRIIHGFLGGSVFSKVFGTIFPGDGTLYLKQTMSFFKPMHTNTEYVATFNVLEIDYNKNRALVETKIIDIAGTTIITGEALIQNKRILPTIDTLK
jgi:3-hydroxybutyryl-CoA dehydratase